MIWMTNNYIICAGLFRGLGRVKWGGVKAGRFVVVRASRFNSRIQFFDSPLSIAIIS